MNVKTWLKKAKERIGGLDAELVLLDSLTGDSEEVDRDRSWLVAHSGDMLSEETVMVADARLERRAAGVPLAYIRGYKEFYGSRFAVTPEVLIPRAETETMIDMIKELPEAPQSILDVGTGSGCIAITLAKEFPDAEVTATDLSEEALTIARYNAREQLVANQIDFRWSDLMQDYGGPADVVTANLPYLDADWEWLDKDALSFEPEMALYAGSNGLEYIYRLLEQAVGTCVHLLIEADPVQHRPIIKKAEKEGFRHDLTRGFILQFSYPEW